MNMVTCNSLPYYIITAGPWEGVRCDGQKCTKSTNESILDSFINPNTNRSSYPAYRLMFQFLGSVGRGCQATHLSVTSSLPSNLISFLQPHLFPPTSSLSSNLNSSLYPHLTTSILDSSLQPHLFSQTSTQHPSSTLPSILISQHPPSSTPVGQTSSIRALSYRVLLHRDGCRTKDLWRRQAPIAPKPSPARFLPRSPSPVTPNGHLRFPYRPILACPRVGRDSDQHDFLSRWPPNPWRRFSRCSMLSIIATTSSTPSG